MSVRPAAPRWMLRSYGLARIMMVFFATACPKCGGYYAHLSGCQRCFEEEMDQ